MEKIKYYKTREEALDAAHNSVSTSYWIDTIKYDCNCGKCLAYVTEIDDNTNIFVVCKTCHEKFMT